MEGVVKSFVMIKFWKKASAEEFNPKLFAPKWSYTRALVEAMNTEVEAICLYYSLKL